MNSKTVSSAALKLFGPDVFKGVFDESRVESARLLVDPNATANIIFVLSPANGYISFVFTKQNATIVDVHGANIVYNPTIQEFIESFEEKFDRLPFNVCPASNTAAATTYQYVLFFSYWIVQLKAVDKVFQRFAFAVNNTRTNERIVHDWFLQIN